MKQRICVPHIALTVESKSLAGHSLCDSQLKLTFFNFGNKIVKNMKIFREVDLLRSWGSSANSK